jgi:patatin-like phospholipase/acyl hydrolase
LRSRLSSSASTALGVQDPHLKGTNHRDDNYTLVDVCLAISAAPIYRSLAAVDHPDGGGGFNVFADGGLWRTIRSWSA